MVRGNVKEGWSTGRKGVRIRFSILPGRVQGLKMVSTRAYMGTGLRSCQAQCCTPALRPGQCVPEWAGRPLVACTEVAGHTRPSTH